MLKETIIRKLGGFPDLESAVEAHSHEALTKVVAEHFNTITEDDILSVGADGFYTLEGKPLGDAQTQALKGYAKDFRQSLLYKVLDREMKYQLNTRMFARSAGETDLIAGKLGIWMWKVIKEKLEKL